MTYHVFAKMALSKKEEKNYLPQLEDRMCLLDRALFADGTYKLKSNTAKEN